MAYEVAERHVDEGAQNDHQQPRAHRVVVRHADADVEARERREASENVEQQRRAIAHARRHKHNHVRCAHESYMQRSL